MLYFPYMTLIASLLAVIVPSVVSAITGWLKNLPSFTYLQDANRTPRVRFLAAFVALISVLLAEWIAGAFDANIIATAVQTVALTAAAWVASLGIFHGIFQPKTTPSA